MESTSVPEPAGIDVEALLPGDVLLLGIFEEDRGDRRCSDFISCMNVWGQRVFAERFAGVDPGWACHAAIYVGEGKLVHATGPGVEPVFHVAVEDAEAYLAEHPRLGTVFRCNDQALARNAAETALRLAEVTPREQRFTTVGLLVRLTLQAMFPGRGDRSLVAAVTRSVQENTGSLHALDGVLSCSAFVSGTFHAAAQVRGKAVAMEHVSADVSPYELFVALLDSPRWQVVARQVPAGLRPFARRFSRTASTSPRPLKDWPAHLLLLPSLLVVLSVVAVFALGLGRRLQALLLERCSTSEREVAGVAWFAPVLRRAPDSLLAFVAAVGEQQTLSPELRGSLRRG